MEAQSNVGQSMPFHHKWLFILSSQEGVTHRGVNYEWFWLNAAAAYAWLDLNGLQSDTVGCSAQRVPAVRNRPPFSLISSDAQTACTKTQTHTTAQRLHFKMSINICICVHFLQKTHHIVCSTVLWIIICHSQSYGRYNHISSYYQLCISKFCEY